MKIKESIKCKTAFITKHGLFKFKRMIFGLCNAPTKFSKVVNLILKGLILTVVLALIDDVLAFDQDFDSHICYFVKVFQRFRENGIKLKREKMLPFKTRRRVLGENCGKEKRQSWFY